MGGIDAKKDMCRLVEELKGNSDSSSLDTEEVIKDAETSKDDLEKFIEEVGTFRVGTDFVAERERLEALVAHFDQAFQTLLAYHKTLTELEGEKKEADSARKRKDRTQRDKIRTRLKNGGFPDAVALTRANFLFQHGYVESNMEKLKEDGVVLQSTCYQCEIACFTDEELKETTLPLSVYKEHIVERRG